MSRGAVLVVLLASLGVASVSPAIAAADAPPPMCEREFAVDYAAPLQTMPGLDPPPEGELPFGPHNFGIHRIEKSQVVLEGSNFGYRFAAKGAGSRAISLNWQATATLRATDASGKDGPVIARRHWLVRRVESLDAMQLSFPAKRPGVFRVDLRFKRPGGRPLGSYRDYFRVLRRTVDVRVAVSSAVVHRGEPVYGQLENRGASKLNAQHSMRLEGKTSSGDWLEVVQPPTPDTVISVPWLISSGELLPCQSYDVPLDAAPGRYRFVASVNVAPDFKRRSFAGEFEVLP